MKYSEQKTYWVVCAVHVCEWVCLHAPFIQGDCSDHWLYIVSSVTNSNNLRQGLLSAEHCKSAKIWYMPPNANNNTH